MAKSSALAPDLRVNDGSVFQQEGRQGLRPRIAGLLSFSARFRPAPRPCASCRPEQGRRVVCGPVSGSCAAVHTVRPSPGRVPGARSSSGSGWGLAPHALALLSTRWWCADLPGHALPRAQRRGASPGPGPAQRADSQPWPALPPAPARAGQPGPSHLHQRPPCLSLCPG